MRPDWVIIGAGLTGATFARVIAERSGAQVLIVDRREHIGGNVYDEPDAHGVRVQRYGAHIFHTGSTAVWQFLSRFTDWYRYEHRVLAEVDGRLVPVPFNLTSLRELLPDRAEPLEWSLLAEFAGQARIPVSALLGATDVTVRELGEFICEKIFRHYTAKQWGRPMDDIDPAVLARVPVTLSHDDRYFRDRYQAIPRDGYTALVAALLDHPAISVQLGADGAAAARAHVDARVLWTGQLDDYFGYRFGALPYRSLRFEHSSVDRWRALPAAVVNHPGVAPYTRVIDHSYFAPDRRAGTTLTYEYPAAHLPDRNEPFYPVVDDMSRAVQQRYLAAADALAGRVLFAGRLGDFRYYDMHQAVGRALTLAEAALDGRADPRALARAG